MNRTCVDISCLQYSALKSESECAVNNVALMCVG